MESKKGKETEAEADNDRDFDRAFERSMEQESKAWILLLVNFGRKNGLKSVRDQDRRHTGKGRKGRRGRKGLKGRKGIAAKRKT